MKRLIMNIFSIISAVSVIALATVIALNMKFIYYNDIEKLNIEMNSGLSREEIIENYDYLIDYNTSLKVEEFELPTLPFSYEGKTHFEDVRNIFQSLYLIIVLGILSSIVIIYEAVKKGNTRPLKNELISLILIPVMVAVPMALSFEKTFILFHKIMFRNDYWIFDRFRDPVIRILPEAFFMHEAIAIVIMSILAWVVLYTIYIKIEDK